MTTRAVGIFPHGVPGHVVRMTREYPESGALSVATCECGAFVSRFPIAEWQQQDAAIDAHWSSVSGSAP